jgi:hypothetical protein
VRNDLSGCLAPPCKGLDAADAFLDAAERALDASLPDGLLRLEARLAATQADWAGVLHRFEQQLQQLALAGRTVPRYAAMA